MPKTLYELRLQFDSAQALGLAHSVAVPAMVEAGATPQSSSLGVLELAGDEYVNRPWTPDEESALRAGAEEGPGHFVRGDDA